jgi:hypothetical protein
MNLGENAERLSAIKESHYGYHQILRRRTSTPVVIAALAVFGAALGAALGGATIGFPAAIASTVIGGLTGAIFGAFLREVHLR